MVRFVCALLLAALAVSPTIAARRTAPPLSYITDGQLVTGAGTAGATLTPSGTAWNNSSWVDVLTAPADLIVTGIYVKGAVAVLSEIEIGSSPDGSAWTPLSHYPSDSIIDPHLGVPLDGITSGQHVGLRLRKSGTSTATWSVGIHYALKPLSGVITTSTVAAASYPAAGELAITTGSGTAWANGAWTELIASTPDDWSIFSIAFYGGNANEQYEIEIGTGGSGSEVAQMTLPSASGGSGGWSAQFWQLRPFLTFAAGTRISVRGRVAGTTARACVFKLGYYTDFDVTDLKTASKFVTFPNAASGLSVTHTTWAELISSTANPIALWGVHSGNAPNNSVTWRIATGAASSEVIADQVKMLMEGSNARQPNEWLGLPRTIGTGQRISMQIDLVTTMAAKLMYWDDPDFDFRVDVGHGVPWTTGNIAGNASAFANSAWGELVSSASSRALITSLGVNPPDALAFIDVELDLGIGAASSEAVVWTTKLYYFGFNGSNRINLPVPLRVDSGDRVSIRFRKSGTDTGNWVNWANWTPDSSLSDAAPTSFPVPMIFSFLRGPA